MSLGQSQGRRGTAALSKQFPGSQSPQETPNWLSPTFRAQLGSLTPKALKAAALVALEPHFLACFPLLNVDWSKWKLELEEQGFSRCVHLVKV